MRKLNVFIISLFAFYSCSSDENSSNNSNIEFVTIGTQIWQSKNLDVETYRDGTPIPQVTDPTQWANLTTGAWCYYNNDPANNAIYGKLYNWYAIMDGRGLCPVGWHIPSTAEFTTLNTTIGSNGGSLKEVGFSHWYSPNTGATDLYGFKALGAGYMGTFSHSKINQATYFWTSTENGAASAYTWSLLNTDASFNQSSQGKVGGFSVRCIHD